MLYLSPPNSRPYGRRPERAWHVPLAYALRPGGQPQAPSSRPSRSLPDPRLRSDRADGRDVACARNGRPTGQGPLIGVSNWAAWRSQRRSVFPTSSTWPASLQAHYTIAGRDLERELVPMMQSEGIGLMVWSPLAGGFLSGVGGPRPTKMSILCTLLPSNAGQYDDSNQTSRRDLSHHASCASGALHAQR